MCSTFSPPQKLYFRRVVFAYGKYSKVRSETTPPLTPIQPSHIACQDASLSFCLLDNLLAVAAVPGIIIFALVAQKAHHYKYYIGVSIVKQPRETAGATVTRLGLVPPLILMRPAVVPPPLITHQVFHHP